MVPNANSGDHQPSEPRAFDLSAALESVEGDRDLLKEVIEVFLEECPERMVDLKTALGESDFTSVQRNAHTIKGTSRIFANPEVTSLAFELEEKGSRQDLTDATPIYDNLQVAVSNLINQLRSFLNDDAK